MSIFPFSFIFSLNLHSFHAKRDLYEKIIVSNVVKNVDIKRTYTKSNSLNNDILFHFVGSDINDLNRMPTIVAEIDLAQSSLSPYL